MTKHEHLRLSAIARRLNLDASDVLKLARASANLSRWFERECGDSGPRSSWAVERDEETDKPYQVIYWHDGRVSRYPIRDMEDIHRRTVARICDAHGLFHFIQTDPRGRAVYVHTEPLTDADYNRGVAI